MIFEHQYNREPLRLSSNYSTTQSNPFLDNLQTTNTLEQDCLVRLRKQREKIEQATARNEQLQKEVARLKDEKGGLIEIIEQLRSLEMYREKYEALKVEFQRMLGSHQLAEYEIEELKVELERAVTCSEEEAERLKGVIKQQKEANSMHVNHLEGLMAEKDEMAQRMKRQAKAQEDQLIAKNYMLREQNQSLRECLMQQGKQLEQNQVILKKQLKNKQFGLAGSEKCIEQLKKQIKSLKFQIQQLKFQHSKEVEQYKELIDQTRTGLKLLMREKEAKEGQNAGLREQIKRYEAKCKVLEEKALVMKENMSKWKSKVQQYQSKRQQTKYGEQQKLQQAVLRLRKQNEKHVDDYNLLSVELKRAKSVIQQKDSHILRRKSITKPRQNLIL